MGEITSTPSASSGAAPQVRRAGARGSSPGPKPPQALTVEVITSSTNVLRGRGEPTDHFLGRLTHLQLQGRRLGPALESLDLVPNVYVMYAYDNMLCSLAGLEHLRRLQLLYLQNNRLTEMSGIEGLVHLKKLHLSHNRLARIEGLENCTELEELYVSHQHPVGSDAPLEFCERSISAIAGSLRLLDAGGNRLEAVTCLAPLQLLQSVDLSSNNLRQVSDLRELLSSEHLLRVHLAGNPLAANERRHRAAVVLMAKAIEEIDGRAVLPQERDFVRRLEDQRRKLEAQKQRHLRRSAEGSPAPMPTKAGIGPAAPGAVGEGRTSAPPVLQDLLH